jgi:hypothetical protein
MNAQHLPTRNVNLPEQKLLCLKPGERLGIDAVD